MRPTRTTWLWTILALLLSMLSPAAHAAWQCEGRTCGTSVWNCCCTSPGQARDSNCANQASAGTGMACGTDCNCTLRVTAVDRERGSRAHALTAPVFFPALVPAAERVVPSLPAVERARGLETRGPPTRDPGLPAVGLRGPPSLTLSIGC